MTEPTCQEEGFTEYLCIRCGDWYVSDYTDRIEHDYEAVVTPPTNEEQGYTTYTCTMCGHSYIGDYVDPGEPDPTPHTPGDITGDGLVNNKDLTRLFRYLSGFQVEVNEAALDITGDGLVNNKDLTRLFRYLSGFNVDIR